MPGVNWALFVGVLAVALFFGCSSALASAYGIAVPLTMMITTMLTYFVVRETWPMPAPLAIGATAFFLRIDALLVAGCATTFLDGGWFPLSLGLVLFLLMTTGLRGGVLSSTRQCCCGVGNACFDLTINDGYLSFE